MLQHNSVLHCYKADANIVCAHWYDRELTKLALCDHTVLLAVLTTRTYSCCKLQDRTNVAQFSVGVHALGCQLFQMGISNSHALDSSSQVSTSTAVNSDVQCQRSAVYLVLCVYVNVKHCVRVGAANCTLRRSIRMPLLARSTKTLHFCNTH
jgi:hypothetical protein